MILVEGKLKVGNRMIPFQTAFFSEGPNFVGFMNREKELGSKLKVVDRNYFPDRKNEDV